MTAYRCYLIDHNRHVFAVSDLSANGDAEATGKAQAVASESGAASFELWDGVRLVVQPGR
jgi:hypothetical protein